MLLIVFDSPHPYGLNLFLIFMNGLILSKIFTKQIMTIYKDASDFAQKFSNHQNFVNKNKNFQLLDSNVSHNQLI